VSTRVLQLLGPSTGGIRTHVGELTRRLRDRGWLVEVAGPDGVMGPAGDQTASVAVPSSWNPIGVLRARRQLRPLLVGCDVVHVHGLKAALVVATIRRRPPTVLTIHNLVVGTARGTRARVLGTVERVLIGRMDEVVVISPEIATRVAGIVPPTRVHRITPVSPQRVPTRDRGEVRREFGIDKHAPLVVIVARHHEQKDLPMFLRAMARVRDQLPEVRAIMVGDGPKRPAVEAERHRLGLDAVVTIAGFRPNPVDEMNAADVVALSSRWEGSPLAVAECLLIGTPLVTTAVGSVPELLIDGESARIVAVRDDSAFAVALIELLSDPDRARELGAAGRAIAGRAFDPERLVDGVEAVYRAALADKHRR
jgi:glycosyltransferase involved in cell wall biosynthesis